MKRQATVGHITALITIIIWGTTFISTKILLRSFTPIEILFFRFLMGFVALAVAYPRPAKWSGWKEERYFVAAGLCGVTLYFLFENIALTYTYASNVGVICSIAPFFTALFAHIFLKEKSLNGRFLMGFVLAIAGICLISFNGSQVLKLNPRGDILAFMATIVWAIYSIIMTKINAFGYNTIQSTRRIFKYGLIFMIPALFIFDFHLDLSRFTNPTNLLNMLFLGLGASAMCFATWNFAVKVLGAVKTSVYIYVVPVVTLITAAIILKEHITLMAAGGTCLILTGLILSQSKASEPVAADTP